jgi:RNA polymerase sigma factor (sigma-70 family)
MAIERLGAALRQINRLFANGVVAGLSDAQLLERFLTRGDAGAFEALVGRHGPMVLSVCRGILRDPSDAEDAFQATFLVLVQKGGTIRGRDALGGWLYQVAHRVAIQANAAAARRRKLERQVGQMAVASSTNGPAASDDLLPALHEEIARLPEKYRLAIILCDLEGMTQAQAAGQLHWSERTLRQRLAEGRARLKRRLARRGLAPDGAMLGAVFLREARAVVPPAWCESTVRAALATVNHTAAAGAVSTAAYKLTQEVFKIMLFQKLTLASAALITVGVTAWAASAALGIDKREQDAVAVAQVPKTMRPLVLPGSTRFDPARIARIRARFAPARVIQIAQVLDRSAKTGNTEFRELRPGDIVSKGDLLGILYSVDVGSKKNELLDVLVQLDLDQKILDEAQKHVQAVPQVFMLSAERTVQGDRNAINRAVNNLKLWDIPQEEIAAVHAEAKKISADKDKWVKTPEGRWVKREKPAAVADADPGKNEEHEDPWGRVTLRAPIDGVVIECNVRKGEMVLDNTVNLFQIADVSRLQVIANCPEGSLPLLDALDSKQRRWTVRPVGAGSAAGLSGTIDEIGQVIDPKQHTAVIKGYVDNPGKRMRAGQSVTATVSIPLK